MRMPRAIYPSGLILLALLIGAVLQARPYKRYLSVMDAERTLANVVLHPRLSKEEWSNLLGEDKKHGSYKVQQGDNLWRISQRVLGDPFLWRKLWQVNEDISNPHEIEPGRLLAFYREASASEVPVVKLVPSGKGKVNDLDEDMVVHQNWVSRVRIMHFTVSEKDVLGKIKGSYTDNSVFTVTDKIYLDLDPRDTVRIGDVVSLAHEESLPLSKRGPKISTAEKLLRLVGQAKIIDIGEKLIEAEVTECFDTIGRGDWVVLKQKTVVRTVAKAPPNELFGSVVAGDIPERKHFSQGELLVINKGLNQGFQEGYLFRVYQDTDPEQKSRATVEPSYKGEVQIVYSASDMSVGYVLRNHEPISVGDALLPPQHFRNPPKRTYRESTQVDLDE